MPTGGNAHIDAQTHMHTCTHTHACTHTHPHTQSRVVILTPEMKLGVLGIALTGFIDQHPYLKGPWIRAFRKFKDFRICMTILEPLPDIFKENKATPKRTECR